MGEAAPLVATPAAPVPPGGAAEWFTGAGGYRLRAALFPAVGEARGSVVLSGGRTEPIEKYFEVIEELRHRGFTVLAHDWRGQGLSQRLLPDRLRGHARNADDFLADYQALIAAFEDRLPKPWIAMGHSMGGCLTTLALARGEDRFAACALSAAMLGLHLSGIPHPVAVLLARTLTLAGAGGGYVQQRQDSPTSVKFEDNILTHDAHRYARNQAQIIACPDLILGGPTWGWLNFALSACHELRHGPGTTKINIPLFLVAAGDDRLVDVAQQREVIGRIPGARFVEAPGAFHEILQETDETRAIFWREFDALVARLEPDAALV